jgi:hypothetical protein
MGASQPTDPWPARYVCLPLYSLVSSRLPYLCQFLNLQHGEDECRLNTIEACVISLWPDAVMPTHEYTLHNQ